MSKILARYRLMLQLLTGSLLLGGCAQIPREPLVHQPMTARADMQQRPAPPVNGAIYRTGFGSQALFEDRRPRYIGDILTILVSENVNASKNSAADAAAAAAPA